MDLNPNDDKISLTSVATNLNKFTTFSGVPVNFSLNEGFHALIDLEADQIVILKQRSSNLININISYH
mgnify:CR=1 FL=1